MIVNGKIVSNNTVANNTQTNTTMIETNTQSTMANIKSIEIVQNIPLGNKSITEGFVSTCLSKGKGRTIVTTRGIGGIYENGRDLSLFASFLPLPDAKQTSGFRNNRVVVIFHMEDGSSKTLNPIETVKFWNEVIGTDDSESYRFKVIADLPFDTYKKDMVVKGIVNHRFQSIRVKINDVSSLFSFTKSKDFNGQDVLVLRPNQGEVSLHSQVVELASQTIGFELKQDFFVGESTTKPDFTSCATTSSKRREGRKSAQTKAARKSVADKRRETTSEVVATPVDPVATPQVDMAAMIQQAVAAAIAPLTQEISSLREELKTKDAEIQALKAASTPVVEEAPEPVVEEEPAVEETVEEPETTAVKSEADFLAALGKSARKKASTNTASQVEVLWNIDDDE